MATNLGSHDRVLEQQVYSPYYVSWGLRLLSEVASHVRRCSKCYAVEEESENIEGGWAIATPKGSCRTSIVTHPVYVEITSKYSYFCMACFNQCFSATMELQSVGGKVLEENSLANIETSRLITITEMRFSDLKKLDVRKEECKEEVVVNGGKKQRGSRKNKRKKKSDSTKKGGRCSRINGRGWQCKETTLAGYALCEYHLALARSRTMESKFG